MYGCRRCTATTWIAEFLFGFGVHERREVTHYRRVGPPVVSIELIRNEVNNLSTETPAH